MGVREVMAVVEHSVYHVHRSLACGSAEQKLCWVVNSVYDVAIIVWCAAP